MQRSDWKRILDGKTVKKYDAKSCGDEDGETPARPRNLKDILAEEGAYVAT